MNRKVYLIGEIGKRFGSEFSMNVNSYANIINCIDCNRPGFREYLLECHNEGIEFAINFAGNDIGEEDLLTPIKEGDVTITAVPAGSKSDGMKVVTGAVLMIISMSMGDVAGVMRGIQLMTMSIGVSLTMQGIQGMLAPDPATDEDEDEGYLYTGDTNIIIEGDPVPLLYGELRIPGQPISVAVNNSATGGGLSPVEEHATVHAVVGNYQNTTITQIFNPEEQDVFLGEALGGDHWNPNI